MSTVVHEPRPVVLTEPEVARVLRVTERTVRRWVAAGTLTVIKVGGVRRYRLRDVAALIDPPTSEAIGAQSDGSAKTTDEAAGDACSG